MTIAIINLNVGTAANDGTGDPLRTGMQSANTNFSVIKSAIDTLQTDVPAAIVTSKAYADSLVVGLWDDRGTFNASTNLFPTTGGSGTAGAILKGDIWTIGTIATSGVLLDYPIGSTVRALTDTPGQTAVNWAVSMLPGLPAGSGLSVGTITTNPVTPSDSLLLNGAAVSRTTYAALFAVIGTRYGIGDGSTTFNLPVAWDIGTNAVATNSLPSAGLECLSVLLADGRVLYLAGSSTATYFCTISDGTVTYAAGTVTSFSRGGSSLTLLADGRVLLFGNGTGNCFILTISGNTITYTTAAGTLPTLVFHTANLLSDGRVLILGGGYNASTFGSTTYFITIAGNSLTSVAGTALPSARGKHTTGLLKDGRLLIAGGCSADGTSQISTVLLATISGNTITYINSTNNSLPQTRSGHTGVVLDDGRVLLLGGSTVSSVSRVPTCLLLTVSGDTVYCKSTGSLIVGRDSGTSVKLTNGDVLTLGGVGAVVLSSVEFMRLCYQYIKT